VKQSFLRLTPDASDQIGFLWSRSPVNSPNFSMVLKFRISGNNQKDYGDFLSLGVLTDPRYLPGNTFLHRSEFTGFFVVIQSNSSKKITSDSLREISVVANDGSFSETKILEEMKGCSAPLRYYEGRDDFNILKASRLRIKYSASNKELEVEMDIRNTGKWRRCTTFDLSQLNLSRNWLTTAYVGLLGSTSELTDNHDVLSLKTYDSTEGAEEIEAEEGLDAIGDDYIVLIHHMEHELYEVHSQLQKTLNKLFSQEQESEHRIASLESKLGRQVVDKMNDRLDQLENKVKTNIELAVGQKLEYIGMSIGTRFEDGIEEHILKTYGDWKAPFFFLVILISGIMLFAFKQYKTIKRTHMY